MPKIDRYYDSAALIATIDMQLVDAGEADLDEGESQVLLAYFESGFRKAVAWYLARPSTKAVEDRGELDYEEAYRGLLGMMAVVRLRTEDMAAFSSAVRFMEKERNLPPRDSWPPETFSADLLERLADIGGPAVEILRGMLG